ncbi:MAG: hypothetical protein BWY91_02503 [bacterium ADurb.BinA028]|nr:MAG: hypothetical protein BWY91_02503 [bacterium ADurb.BinA028]
MRCDEVTQRRSGVGRCAIGLGDHVVCRLPAELPRQFAPQSVDDGAVAGRAGSGRGEVRADKRDPPDVRQHPSTDQILDVLGK